MENKINQLSKYSDIDQVIKKLKKYYDDDITFDISTRKDKKYMLLNPHNNKWIHFGQMGFEDFTYHNDLIRRDRFKKRNKKWAKAEKYSSAFASYYLLW